MSVFGNLLLAQLPHEVTQDILALSAIQDESQLFPRDFSSHRFKKFPPCARVRRVTVHDYSIKVEDRPSKHHTRLPFVMELALAIAFEQPGRSQAFRYQLENPVLDTLPFGQQF